MTLRTVVQRGRSLTAPRAVPPPRPAAHTALPVAREPESDWAHLRRHAMVRIEESLDHVPTVLRRLGTFLLVGSIAMVAFLVAIVIVLAHAVA